MKTDVEELSPTRVKLTIEVPFEEIKSNLDKAYREVGKQVRIKGFRPGKVPPRVIDQFVGRAPVLEQAINEAVPQLFNIALTEQKIFPLGQPDYEVTRLNDPTDLEFTVEVDRRPAFVVPVDADIEVTVDSAEPTEEEIDRELDALRDRFSTLTAADRPAQDDDYVSIDLSAAIDGTPVEGGSTSGLSYQVGSEGAVTGLNEALRGMSAGETKTFDSTLAAGSNAGEQAQVTVTVHSVKIKNLPALDDEFAALASEFDTLDALRGKVVEDIRHDKRHTQVNQAQERAVEALMEKIDIPLPENVVTAEVAQRREELDQQLTRNSMTMEEYLAAQSKTEEEFGSDLESAARKAIKNTFVFDQLVVQEDLSVSEEELTQVVVYQAREIGVTPDVLARYLAENGQLPALMNNVLRGKAQRLIVEHAKVTDTDGNAVDLVIHPDDEPDPHQEGTGE